MRLAADRSGSLFGPFAFEAIQRRNKPPYRGLAFTIRFGYVNMQDNCSTYTYSPLNIHQRRGRKSAEGD